jgi:hypothetical protein
MALCEPWPSGLTTGPVLINLGHYIHGDESSQLLYPAEITCGAYCIGAPESVRTQQERVNYYPHQKFNPPSL